jgi:hypothetical protein
MPSPSSQNRKLANSTSNLQGIGKVIQKGVIERLVSMGLTRELAEVAVLMADGAKMSDLKKALGNRSIRLARFLKTLIGPRSQIKAVVESCWLLMLVEEAEEKQGENVENELLGENDPLESTDEGFPG